MTARNLAVFLTSLLLAIPAVGQQQKPFQNAPQNARLSVSFDGGTVADYIASIRTSDPQVNIVEMGDLSVFDMPAVQLKNVTLRQALDVLDNMRAQRGATLHLLDVDEHGGPTPVYSIHTGSRLTEDASAGKLFSRVWSVGRLLESDTISQDALLSGIESAVNLSPDLAESTKINFHRETNLLLARGPLQSMNAIEEVIQQLWSAGPQRQSELDALRKENEALRKELDQIRQMREQAEQELREMQMQRAELEAELRARSMENQELQHRRNQAERELIEMRNQLQQMKLELARQSAQQKDNAQDKP